MSYWDFKRENVVVRSLHDGTSNEMKLFGFQISDCGTSHSKVNCNEMYSAFSCIPILIKAI